MGREPRDDLEGAIAIGAAPEVALDLVEEAERAFALRDGVVLGPGIPGWARATQLADRGPWGEPTEVDGAPMSWLDGIGGTLYFPIGPDGLAARHLSLQLRPVAAGQVVSVFLDEVPIATLRLDAKLRTYVLRLPDGGLSPGEHSLRFWFRFTRPRAGKRTPAALGLVRLSEVADPAAAPVSWRGPLSPAREAPRAGRVALFAGPPLEWSHYLLPPAGARLFARAAVAEGEPVTFSVRIERDEEPEVEASRVTLAAGQETTFEVDLGPYAGSAVRLGLRSEGASGPAERAGWIEASIVRPARPSAHPPPVRNVIIWAIDGLRGDRVGLGRGGDRAATPNLDLLAREGAAAVDVWSGGAGAEEGHRRLLRPSAERSGLAERMAASGRRVAVFSTSAGLPVALIEGFQKRVDLARGGGPAEIPVLMRELDEWLGVRKREPLFVYLATHEGRAPFAPTDGLRRQYERARPLRGDGVERERQRRTRDPRNAHDATLSTADYWVGQLVALLSRHELLSETAIVVVGSVGQELREHGGLGDGHALVPEVLHVAAVVWHPQLRRTGPQRALARGGDLGDIGATALALVGETGETSWPGADLTTALFHELPIVAAPSRARLGNHVAARFGDWLLRGTGTRDLRLWQLGPDLRGVELDAESHPITLRAVRNSMLDLE